MGPLSCAAMRAIRHRIFSALVGLAAKGYFKIDEQGDEFALERQDNHAEIQATRKAHEKALRHEYETRNFRLNSKYLWIGSAILLTIYTIALLAQTNAEDKFTGLFMSTRLGIWSIGVYMLATRAFRAWRLTLRPSRSILSVMGAIGMTIFALPFVGGEIFGAGILIHTLGVMVTLLLVSGIALSLLFHHLLKAPTPAGQRLLDRIDGFRLYLSVAEANDLKMTIPRAWTNRCSRPIYPTPWPWMSRTPGHIVSSKACVRAVSRPTPTPGRRGTAATRPDWAVHSAAP